MPPPKKIPQNSKLGKMIIDRALSISQLSAVAGIDARTIHNTLAGTQRPYWSTIVKLAAALNCDPHEIDPVAHRPELRLCVICGSEFETSPTNETFTCSKECAHAYRSDFSKSQKYIDQLNKAHEVRKTLPYMCATEEFIRAKSWKIKSPDGQVYECRNLMLWLREHSDMLDGTVKQAWDGITKIKYTMQGKRKNKLYQWKGWTLLEYEE